ncbi:MAG TPA: hypothetical protein VKP60_08025 [Magnetospirillaceae bacterium]|nr:hypothetical protein [Magnetospirillaceae bacterium]
MSAVSQAPTLDPLAQIEDALKTDVIDILRGWFDRLAGMDRAAAYETVMNEPEILHDAFTLLRRQPQLFSSAIVDQHGQAVDAKDDQRLRCGETLGHIKTLVLRAAARRHFRRKLGGSRTVLVKPQRQIGAFRRMMESIGVVSPPPLRRRRVTGRGDSLYQAMRDYLVFDWQARLIPHYTQFSPDTMAELGSSILEIREPAELRALAGDEGRAAMSQRRRPLFLSGASQLLQTGSDSIDSELLWKLWEQMGMDRLFEEIDVTETRKIIAEIAATSKMAVNLLIPILGEDVRRFVSFLFVAYKNLGRINYRNVFSDTGATQWMAKVYADRLSKLPGLPPPAFEEMTEVFSMIVSSPNKPGE